MSAREGEAQERAVGWPGATQASPHHTAPLPPLRDGRELSKNPTPESPWYPQGSTNPPPEGAPLHLQAYPAQVIIAGQNHHYRSGQLTQYEYAP